MRASPISIILSLYQPLSIQISFVFKNTKNDLFYNFLNLGL